MGTRREGHRVRPAFLGMAAALSFLGWGWAPGVRGDETPLDIVLFQSGGRIAGKVSELADSVPPSLLIETADGQKLRFAKSQVRQVIRASEALREYQLKVRDLPDTIDAHLAMADWCKENLESTRFRNGPNRLSPQRRHHLNEVLRFDPDHSQTRMLLGYTKSSGGEWVNLEQVRLANGMVEYKNKWWTNEQLQIQKAKEAWEQQTAEWRGRLRRWRNSNASDWPAAQREVRGIKDPAATGELFESIKKEDDLAWVMAYVDALGNIPPAAAAGLLADLAVLHADQGVRERCLAFLKQKGVDRAAVADRIETLYLRNSNNELINRAGFILGELQQTNSILPLIDRLVTTHTVANPQAGSSGQIGAGFAPQGQSGLGGGGLSIGNNQPASLKVQAENRAVLEGLRKITGVNFDFDQQRWQDWYAESRTLVEVDVRRD